MLTVQDAGMNPVADAVRRERLRRGWSVRDAATAGGISNTYWGNFEDYRQPLTDGIRVAVAKAFDWAEDWPTSLPEDPQVASLRAELETLRSQVAALSVQVGDFLEVAEARVSGGTAPPLSGAVGEPDESGSG